jgi:16S rRNA (guanine527-N7)-methyltransferase
LVIAAGFKEMRLCLVDSMAKRCEFLIAAVADLDWTDRVTVFCGRAEEFARQHREAFDAVTARSLAAPAVTAEIAAGLVGIGGSAVVSSAPNARSRWDEQTLAMLGFGRMELVVEQGRSFALLTKTDPCPPKFPRRAGVPAKRPLW